MKKIMFITGTRADYGKLKPLMKAVEESLEFELYIYVSGMHILKKYGFTYQEILKDGYKNVQIAFGQHISGSMSYALGNVVCNLTGYVDNIKPDMIVVHGDRIDALAGAVVGALNNILVAHIEGGEVSGTIDDSIRHAVSKFSHIHFVSNEEAKKRLLQMGEPSENIKIFGSPDIDVMLSPGLPALEDARKRYEVDFPHYGILMYHPVTTELKTIGIQAKAVVDAVLASHRQYIVVYPNNDMGTEIILNEYARLENNHDFRIFPSIRFEYFLVFLKNADFVLGNSSAGIRESGIYGVPAIDIGDRQHGRYDAEVIKNIQHVNGDKNEILDAIGKTGLFCKKNNAYGCGNSTGIFMDELRKEELWNQPLQKHFYSIDELC